MQTNLWITIYVSFKPNLVMKFNWKSFMLSMSLMSFFRCNKNYNDKMSIEEVAMNMTNGCHMNLITIFKFQEYIWSQWEFRFRFCPIKCSLKVLFQIMFEYFRIAFSLCVICLSFIFIVVFFKIHLSTCYSLGQHFGCHNVSYVIDITKLMQIAR